MLDYYARIAPVILPHLRDRPVTRIRYPHGVGDMQFFEKNIPAGTPPWIRRAGRDPVFPFIDDLAALTYFANLNSLELHVPQWRYEGEGRDAVPLSPDRLVIDLDPGPGTGLHECARVALIVRERLGEHRARHRCPSRAAARACSCMPCCPARTRATRSATPCSSSPRS